jgi:hypothetical protein
MRATIWAALVIVLAIVVVDGPVAYGAGNGPVATRDPSSARGIDVSAQRRLRRPPARITVFPVQTSPGPNAVRQCRAWLAPEYRPSGTVIVPRMHCWWER